jgi:2-polyprenyl-6-methoxyphenol hydroxylase-like FAD-dependent oxidoreductase
VLLIGDAAHPMTPAAGAGIKYAIEDAIEVANVLAAPLLQGTCRLSHLEEVQRRRECAIRAIQAIASTQQRTLLARALRTKPPTPGRQQAPLLARIFTRVPLLRDLPARIIAFGFRRVRLADSSDVLTPLS